MKWNKTKKTVIDVAVALAAAALIAVFCSPAMARVQGVCSNCHTMHDSQGGTAMASGGLHATLLMNSCVGCHSSVDSSTTYSLGGCTVPVVNYTGGSGPTDYLAGGNFYWVATEASGRTDAKGHNVFASNPDGTLSIAPGGVIVDCNNCHGSLATASSGCQGCHRKPAHHADDSATVIGATKPSTDGYYRFLSAHNSGAGGVCGIEDSNWQATADATNHNEYLGNAVNLTTSANMGSLGHTMTGFCCGCHGEFHKEQDGAGNWIRHPSDAVIPATGEYQYAFASAGDGAAGTYDPLVPVARSSLTAVSSEVNLGTDMVMCLSCHRPHGSPYDDLLRWDYSGMIAGGGDNASGCFACHTKKDTGG